MQVIGRVLENEAECARAPAAAASEDGTNTETRINNIGE